MQLAPALPYLALLLIFSWLGCNKQKDYSHTPKEFTALDHAAIARVRRMPLSRAEVLQSIASEITEENSPNLTCQDEDYEVRRVIRRDLKEIEGTYLEEIHVICRTETGGNSPLLRFEWVFDGGIEHFREFKFGVDPSEYPEDLQSDER